MQNMETLQLVKEQLLLKTAEVKKHEVEKEKISEKIKSVLALNDKKIKELKSLVKEKEDAVIAAQSAANMSYTSESSSKKGEGSEGGGESEGGSGSGSGSGPGVVKEVVVQDPKLLEELEALRKKDQDLAEQIKAETGEKEKFNREKNILLKEMRRLRKDPETVNNLKEQIDSLNEEVKKMKDRSLDTANNLEELLMEKDEVIASYEKMLYGETEAGQEGMLPSEIIEDLKEELKERLEEKKAIVTELEEIKEINAELELKISLTEESSTSDRLDAGARQDSRAAQSAEFSGSLEGFLVTYSDMITLLLVIFVLMYTVSKLDEEKLAEALSSFQERKMRVATTNMRLTKDELKMMARVKELVKDNVDPDSIIRSDTRTILKRLPTSELFGPGSAELVEGAEKLIEDAIKEDMIDGVKQVIVDGHTDDIPIKSAKFPSNWELSTARASRVARFIVETMRYPAKFVAVSGYGPHRPIKANTNDFNRALNRRVEIKIQKDKDVIKEGQKDLVPEKTKPKKGNKTDPKNEQKKQMGGLSGLAKSTKDAAEKNEKMKKSKSKQNQKGKTSDLSKTLNSFK
jgi:chemotaxis protein MotB